MKQTLFDKSKAALLADLAKLKVKVEAAKKPKALCDIFLAASPRTNRMLDKLYEEIARD